MQSLCRKGARPNDVPRKWVIEVSDNHQQPMPNGRALRQRSMSSIYANIVSSKPTRRMKASRAINRQTPDTQSTRAEETSLAEQ
jgi:hypothetical protein